MVTKKNKKLALFLLISMSITILIIGFSYAYYLPYIDGKENTSRLVFRVAQTQLAITGVNSFNLNKMYPGDTYSKTFKVTNIGSNAVDSYTITLADIDTNFFDVTELKYQVYCLTDSGKACNGAVYTSFPEDNGDKVMFTASSLAVNKSHNYTLYIKFANQASNQDYNKNKYMSFKVAINSYIKEFANTILAADGGTSQIIAKGNPDYASASPIRTYGYYVNNDFNSSVYSSSVTGDKVVGKSFTFDKSTGLFTLGQVVGSSVIYSSTYQAYYTCDSTATSCSNLYQLMNGFTVSAPNAYVGTVYYFTSSLNRYTLNNATSQTINTSANIYSSSSGDKTVGKGYYFTGERYELTGVVNNAAYNSYINYFTCNSSLSYGNTVYKILTTDTVTDPTKAYIATANIYTATRIADEYQTTNYSGVYSTNDQDGVTYYYRGVSANNYVTFVGLTWRIVRINGDGTIRLVLNDYAKDTNSNYYSVAYNSNSSCAYGSVTSITTAINCAKFGTGTYSANSVKSTLDSWLSNNITGDNLEFITTSKYCNDYSYTGAGTSTTYFGSYYRNNTNKTPSLLCTAPSGYTNGSAESLTLNIGLLTADEIALAGGLWNNTMNGNYLYLDNYYSWTMSPNGWNSSTSYASNMDYGSLLLNNNLAVNEYIRPVINLKNTVMASGEGTITNPYVVTGIKI